MGFKDCPPFSPCFCETHPNVKQCQTATLDIDSNLYFLIIIAIILGFFCMKKYNKSKI
jgi:hypothetical protein